MHKFRLFSPFQKTYPLHALTQLLKEPLATTDLKNTLIVAQLPFTAATMHSIQQWLRLGFKAANILISEIYHPDASVTAKSIRDLGIYLPISIRPEDAGSAKLTRQIAASQLWSEIVEQKTLNGCRIIIVDAFDNLRKEIPKSIGANSPIHSVTEISTNLAEGSAINSQLVLPAIAEKAVRKFIDNYCCEKEYKCGILGDNGIGEQLAVAFNKKGAAVEIYSDNPNDFDKVDNKRLANWVCNADALITRTSSLFCCGEEDLGVNTSILDQQQDIDAYTLSSKPSELTEILQSPNTAKNRVGNDMEIKTKYGATITINNLGFPYVAMENEILTPMQTTACMAQAVLTNDSGVADNDRMLDPSLQQLIVKLNGIADPKFEDPEWIKKNSGGEHIQNSKLEKIRAMIDDNLESCSQQLQSNNFIL